MKSNYGNTLAIMENTLELQSKFTRTGWQIWTSTMRNRQNYEKHLKIAELKIKVTSYDGMFFFLEN